MTYTVTNDIFWQPEDRSNLNQALQRLEKELPGWWWKVGACHVSSDADIGPDRYGPDAALLRLDTRLFDEGFSVDLPQPSTCGEALNHVIDEALAAKKKFSQERPVMKPALTPQDLELAKDLREKAEQLKWCLWEQYRSNGREVYRGSNELVKLGFETPDNANEVAQKLESTLRPIRDKRALQILEEIDHMVAELRAMLTV